MKNKNAWMGRKREMFRDRMTGTVCACMCVWVWVSGCEDDLSATEEVWAGGCVGT